MADDIEARTIAQVARRFIPFLILCYFVAYLDRVNVGFAKLTMDADLGLSETAYGFGAGVFFLAYFLFEVPSNIIMDKVGARVWIARIMLSWGVISGAMAFIPNIARATGISPEYTFYLLRILLGFAEAGFFPGIIFFLTLWFPASYRARIVGYFMAAIPLSSAIGSPVSAALLGLDGAGGLRGWQWLFVAEALPSIVLAVVTFFYLTDRPAEAHWLADDQRGWLKRRLEAEDARREHVSPAGVLASLFDPRVLALSLVYFGNVACVYGVSFWLPTIVKGFGLSIAMTGWVNAIPYVVGFLGMVWWGMRSDRMGERTMHLAISLALAAIGIGASARPDRPDNEDDRADRRLLRRLRFAADLLDPADGVPRRGCGRARDRGDQLDRQSLGLFRPLRHRLDQGRDRQLRLGPGDDRGLRRGRARHHAGARPRPASRTGARSGRIAGGQFMLTRRVFVACAFCAAGGFMATGAEAQTARPEASSARSSSRPTGRSTVM